MKYLSVIVDKNLNWRNQVLKVRQKHLANISQLKKLFPICCLSKQGKTSGSAPLGLLLYIAWDEWRNTLSKRIERISEVGDFLTSKNPQC